MNRRSVTLPGHALTIALGCNAAASRARSNATQSAVPVPPKTTTKAKTMDTQTASPLFELISDLAKARPFRTASLADRLGLSFTLAHENPYFRFYQASGPARAQPAILKAELRASTQAASDGPAAGLLTLGIDPKLCIREADLSKRFGPPPEPYVPSPHAPPDSPVYWVYRLDRCTVSFGFSRAAPACLVTVTLDSIPAN